MNNMKRKLWLKAVSLAVVGVFLSSNLLVPLARADDIVGYTQDQSKVMPVLDPNPWQTSQEAVSNTIQPTGNSETTVSFDPETGEKFTTTTTPNPDGSSQTEVNGANGYHGVTTKDSQGNINYSNNQGLSWTSTTKGDGPTTTQARYSDGSTRTIVDVKADNETINRTTIDTSADMTRQTTIYPDGSIKTITIPIETVIGQFIKDLGDNDYNVRQKAAYALGQIGDPVIEPLIKALGDSNILVYKNAVELLGQIGDPVIEPLIKALGDTRVSFIAAELLAKIGESVIEPLIKALGDNNFRVRKSATYALSQIGDPAVEPLIRILGDSEYYSRYSAAEALGQIGDSRAVEPLIKALDDINYIVREYAAGALGQIGDSRAVEPLIIHALGDIDDNVRMNAVRALVQIGDPRVAELLTKVLAGDTIVSFTAAELLASIGESAIEPLIQALGDSDARVRNNAAYGLGWIGDPRALEPLIKALGDSDKWVRRNAARALTKIGHQQRDYSSVVSPLITVLDSSDPLLHQEAENFLLKILSDEEGIKFLKEKINNETNPTIHQGLKDILTKATERYAIKTNIQQEFGVTIKDVPLARFDTGRLQQIYSLLSNLPSGIVGDLRDMNIEPIQGPRLTIGTYSGAVVSIGASLDIEKFGRVLIHEIAHAIDQKYFGYNAFRDLYAKSKLDADFAFSYGKTNALEDFASTVEDYGMDTQGQFLKAIQQAKKNKPVYLEKVLFVTDVFTKGHADYTIVYKVDAAGVIHTQQIAVDRSAGKITSLNGVSITDLDGLENLFNNLQS